MGSLLVTVEGNQEFSLTADWNGSQAVKHLVPLQELPRQEVSGTLSEEDTTWSGVVLVTDDVTIPAGHTVQVEPGTLILVQGVPQAPQVQLGTQIVVQGTFRSLGTEERPVTITAADPDRPWSELDVDGGNVQLSYTVITRAGTSPRGGHTGTGPAIRLHNDGLLAMNDSSVTDISGKIMQATSGSASLIDVLLSRAVMGPEINETALEFRDSWIIDMAGRYHHNGTVDDNDGIYLHRQQTGQQIELSGGVVAQVQDDGIDTLGSDVLIEDFWVHHADDKAVSVFDGEVRIHRSLLTNSDIGVETKGAGSSRPHTIIDRTTIANTRVGIYAHDKDAPDPDVVITYDITNSIIHVRSGGDPVRTDYEPADLHINYSSLSEPWDYPGSGTGNLDAQPLFLDAAANDFRLVTDSPAIDAGDPQGPVDLDGTRQDLGYFSFDQTPAIPGDVNGDGKIDAEDIDLLCQAIRQGLQMPAHDLDGSGNVDEDDLRFLVRNILNTTPGDANLDGLFNSSDLVKVFQAGQYEDLLEDNSGWATGDWSCDGDFTSSDLVAAFQTGAYERPAAAARGVTSSILRAAMDAAFHDEQAARRRRL